MKSTGVVRQVDELGRFVLPIEIRRSLGINVKDSLEIYTEGDRIVLRRVGDRCVFCDSQEGLVLHKDKCVCRKCIKALTKE